MQNKKNKKSLIVESRLKLLSLALKYQDEDIIEILISKTLQIENLDKEVVDIIHNVEFDLKFSHFEDSINQINEYLKRKPKAKIKKAVVISEDIEIKELKQELKSLEEVLQQLVEEKTEYLTNIEEFNIQYNLHLGELLKTILNLRKEILYKKTIKQQKLKDKYEKDIKICEETKVTIDEIKETIVQLEEVLESIDEDNEDYTEIKNAYDELQVELETLESELKVQEEELEKAKEFIENEDIKNQYEEAKTHYKQYENEYENVKKAQKENIKLNDEEKIELKKLYKKAAKLCHPDIVPDELKEKAHKIMQELNEAYSKQDLNKIKSILTSLETTGFGLLVVSDSIDDKEILRAKLEEFKENISNLEEEIEDIKLDDTFVTISELDNWDEYFEDLKNELQIKKEKLEKEASEILDDVEDWVKTIWTWADENNIPNGKLSRQKENLLATTTIEFIGLKLKNIPKELCELGNITTLVLWDNDISFLPNEIVNFTNLKKLNLRGNPNLAISPNQKMWIETLKGKCSVFIDSVKYLEDETLVILEEKNFSEQFNPIITNKETIRISDIDKEKLIKFIKNWIINKIVALNNINITNILNDMVALQRISYVSNDVYDDLLKNNISNVNLPFITKELNGSPINFVKENITFESLEFKKDINTKSENKLEVIKEESEYSNTINSIEVPNFEKIRRYCNNLLSDNQADDMQEYLANNGKIYKAIIYDALEQFISKLDGQTITLIDWGCGQGIASMIVLDYIKEKQLNIKVSNSILIDDDIKALSRAMIHSNVLSYSDDIKILAYDLNSDISEILEKLDNQTILNLMINDRIYEKIKNIDFENDYFLCLSNQSNVNIDKFYKDLNNSKDVENLSIRDCKIGKFGKFERIFKVDN